MLHPQARALLDLIERSGLPPTHLLTPTDARRVYRERRQFTQPEPPPVPVVRDLAATPAAVPICVLSHIPILSACTFLDGENEKTSNWQVPGQWMHLDVRRLETLFRQHPNVKACLSGHIHLADEVSYLGVRYFCNGAVSGGWWKGPYQEFGPAYAVVDFHDDGTVDNRLVHYRQPPAVAGA